MIGPGGALGQACRTLSTSGAAQVEVARKLGVGQGAISRLESRSGDPEGDAHGVGNQAEVPRKLIAS